MTNLQTILRNTGVGINGVKTDPSSIRKALVRLQMMWNGVEVIAELVTRGAEICHNDQVMVYNNEIVYYAVPA